MNYSKKLTLIIATKNRPKFIRRIINYYNHTNFKGKIIICDSSDKKELIELKEYLKEVKLSINLFHKKTIVPRILKEGLKLTTTKYVCVFSDDDIMLVEGINDAIKFLEKH